MNASILSLRTPTIKEIFDSFGSCIFRASRGALFESSRKNVAEKQCQLHELTFSRRRTRFNHITVSVPQFRNDWLLLCLISSILMWHHGFFPIFHHRSAVLFFKLLLNIVKSAVPECQKPWVFLLHQLQVVLHYRRARWVHSGFQGKYFGSCCTVTSKWVQLLTWLAVINQNGTIAKSNVDASIECLHVVYLNDACW